MREPHEEGHHHRPARIGRKLVLKEAGITGFMIAAGYYTLAYLGAGVAALWFSGLSPMGMVVLALCWLYLLPPLLCRVILAIGGRPFAREATPREGVYMTWWLLTQVQMIFNRFPALEEMLKIVPGLYGLWLNLWGSRVSLLAYWGPGVLVTDRYLVRAEGGAVIGGLAKISSHIVTADGKGGFTLTVAPITLERGALIGGAAMVGPGCRIAAGQMVAAGRVINAFTLVENGKKIKIPL